MIFFHGLRIRLVEEKGGKKREGGGGGGLVELQSKLRYRGAVFLALKYNR